MPQHPSSAIIPVTLTQGGFYGLHHQDSLEETWNWMAVATNCVIDLDGRLAARKGRKHVTTSAISGTPKLRAIGEHIRLDGTTDIISAANNLLYKGTSTLTAITGTAGAATGVTDDHWQFQTINDKFVTFQAAHDPLVRTTGNFSLLQQSIAAWTASTAYIVGDVIRDTSGNKTLYFHCTTAGTTDSSEPTWNINVGGITSDNTVTWTTRKMPNGNICHSAFGRVWVTSDGDDSVIEFSDTLLPHIYRGGASGRLDLKTVWGGDTVVAVGSFEDLLVIFGRKTILLYQGPEDPSTMTLHEKIDGIGCIARDSVSNTGNDIVFLSNGGVFALSRSKEISGRQLIVDMSFHIRTQLMALAASETEKEIKSVYHEPDGLYILALTGVGVEYAFNIRVPNPDRTFKITQWEGFNARSFVSARNRVLYVGSDGVMASYTDFNDGVSGSYLMKWRSSWSNFGPEAASYFKIPKQLKISAFVPSVYTITFNWAYDYKTDVGQEAVELAPAVAGAEWNVMEWGLGEWSGGSSFVTSRAHPTGHGAIMQIGFDVPINGSAFALQTLNLDLKLGRIE